MSVSIPHYKWSNIRRGGGGVQGFHNRFYTSESTKPNLALRRTIKTLHPLNLLFYLLF